MAVNEARQLLNRQMRRTRRSHKKLALLGAVSLLAVTLPLGSAVSQETIPEDPAAGTTIISGSGVYHLPEGVYVPPVLRPQTQESLPEAPERVTDAAPAPTPTPPPAPAAEAPPTETPPTEAPPEPEVAATPETEAPGQPTAEGQQIDQTPVPVAPAPEPAPAPAPAPAPEPQAAPAPPPAAETPPAPEPEPAPAPEPESDVAQEQETPAEETGEAAPPPAVPVAPVEDVTGQPDAPAEAVEEAEPEEEGEQIPPELQQPPGDVFTLAFEPGSSRLPDGAAPTLAEAADRAKLRPGAQITLMAYAAGEEASDQRARRLSLARALAVRGFLIQQGIVSTRVEIRPLGASNLSGEADRVDIIVQR